jgi:hypothetical protein
MKLRSGLGMGERRQIVWVVMHVEIMGHPDKPRVDSLQYHVSSSLEKAEESIRNTLGTASHSWWQIYPFEVDSTDFGDEGQEVYYYSHRGTRLKSAPEKRAISTFRKYVAAHPEWWGPDGLQTLKRS